MTQQTSFFTFVLLNQRNIRRHRGSMVVMTACVCALLMLVGVACFLGSKMLGGHKELSNAVDAGILNTAKVALKQPAATQIPTEFLGCGISPEGTPVQYDGAINLLSYNRAVAQALLVALNAQAEGTPEAVANARLEIAELETLGNHLRQQLESEQVNALNISFDTMASMQNVKMLNLKTTVGRQDDVKSGYMKVGHSSNIFFDNEQLPVPPSSVNGYLNTDASYQKNVSGASFVSGYRPLEISGVGTIYAVPLLPNQRPHVVSLSDFERIRTSPGSYSPPNSFQSKGRTLESTSGRLTNALSCAIVGSLGGQYVAQVPRGYVRIVNAPDSNALPGNPQVANASYDGTNDIFNNELASPVSAIYQGNSGVFSTNINLMNAWKAYNQSTGIDALGHDPLKDPLGPNATPLAAQSAHAHADLRSGGGKSQMATIKDMLNLNSWTKCFDLLYDGSQPHTCTENLGIWISNYDRQAASSTSGSGAGFTAVEWMKANLMQQRQAGRECAIVTPPPVQPSGLKSFSHTTKIASPPARPNFSETGTPFELIQQVGGCSGTAILAAIVQRCKEINPKFTAQDVTLALKSKRIEMGQTLLLHEDRSGALVLSQSLPYMTVQQVDGKNSIQAVRCESDWYRIDKILVDTESGAANSQNGDMNYHIAPYLECPEMEARDRTIWTPSTGYRNLLGEVRFENEARGGGECCKLN